jgi:hypothetical protein
MGSKSEKDLCPGGGILDRTDSLSCNNPYVVIAPSNAPPMLRCCGERCSGTGMRGARGDSANDRNRSRHGDGLHMDQGRTRYGGFADISRAERLCSDSGGSTERERLEPVTVVLTLFGAPRLTKVDTSDPFQPRLGATHAGYYFHPNCKRFHHWGAAQTRSMTAFPS